MDGGAINFIPSPPTSHVVRVCCVPVNQVFSRIQTSLYPGVTQVGHHARVPPSLSGQHCSSGSCIQMLSLLLQHRDAHSNVTHAACLMLRSHPP